MASTLNRKKTLELLGYSTATIFEAFGKKGAFPSHIKHLTGSNRLYGRVRTVDCSHGDNVGLYEAVSDPSTQNGDIIVCNCNGYKEFAYWGDILTCAAQYRGWRGLIINGCIRDFENIQKLGFPIWGSGLSIVSGPAYQGIRRIGSPLDFEGTTVQNGDIVVADTDGIVVIPEDDFDAVLAKAVAKLES